MTLPVYVISLVHAADRRADIGGRLLAANVPFEFIDAVDGSALKPEQYEYRLNRELVRIRNRYDMVAGQIGCFMSHHNLWKRIIDEKTPYALVLEDDAQWDEDFFAVVDEVIRCQWRWNIVLLSHLSTRPASRVLCDVGKRQLVQ